MRRRRRPFSKDAEAHRGRNVVERSFNTLTQWRALTTHYDKTGIVYRGAAVLRTISIGVSTTPLDAWGRPRRTDVR